MTVKELLNKYDFYNYDKTGFESFAVFFPKDDFEKAKSFDIDYIDSIENHKELFEKQLDLEVLYYKIMRADELEKTIFKHETWTHNDKVAFAFSKWICILVKTLQNNC